LAPAPARLATLANVIAIIFHWWLGVLLLAVALLAVVGVVAGYLKFVVAPQYPSKRYRRDD
jgi:hypothetical protein